SAYSQRPMRARKLPAMKTIILQIISSFQVNLRNPANHARSRCGFLLIPLILVCFALCQQGQSAIDALRQSAADTPKQGAPDTPEQSAPDAPDPGGPLPFSNTADGHLALASVTTGIYNSAFGTYSLLSLTDASFCTAVGGAALIANTASNNTAVGAGAL